MKKYIQQHIQSLIGCGLRSQRGLHGVDVHWFLGTTYPVEDTFASVTNQWTSNLSHGVHEYWRYFTVENFITVEWIKIDLLLVTNDTGFVCGHVDTGYVCSLILGEIVMGGRTWDMTAFTTEKISCPPAKSYTMHGFNCSFTKSIYFIQCRPAIFSIFVFCYNKKFPATSILKTNNLISNIFDYPWLSWLQTGVLYIYWSLRQFLMTTTSIVTCHNIKNLFLTTTYLTTVHPAYGNKFCEEWYTT